MTPIHNYQLIKDEYPQIISTEAEKLFDIQHLIMMNTLSKTGRECP